MMTLSNKPTALTPAKETILREAIYPFHYATLEQVGRVLGYKETAYNGVGQHLLRMIDKDEKTGKETEKGYLTRFKLPTGFPLQPYVYLFGHAGREYIKKELHWELLKIPSLEVMKRKSNTTLMHWLEINNVIIAAKLLRKHNPNAHLIRFTHDVFLKKYPIVSAPEIGRKISISPDAILEIEADGRRVFWIEVETGKNNDEYILNKMRDIYEVFDRRHFQDAVAHTNRCRVCYMTLSGYTGVERLRRLARTVLTERLGEKAPYSKRNLLFNFIAISPMGEGGISIPTTFLHASWLHPFHLDYFPILEVKE